jgi:type I restriction enzyme S subunit
MQIEILETSAKPQNSGKELPALPEGWKWVRLGEVCKTTSGGTPNRKDPSFYNGNIPWVKSGELDKGIIADTEEKITERAIQNSSAKVFPKGTLLIALYGATIGKLAFLGIDAATNQAVCGIYQNKTIDSKYLYYFLFFSKPALVKQGIGGAQPNISQGILKELLLPLPTLPIQQAIVAKIEELFSELDKSIESLKIAQQQLKVYRQSVLKWAFEGKLHKSLNYDLNDEMKTMMAAESQEPYGNQSPSNNHKNHGSDNLPEGWKWVTTKDVISIINNGYTPTSEFLSQGEGEIPFIKVYNLNFDGTLNFQKNPTFIPFEKHKKDLKRSICIPGDVLINIVGPPLGKVSIVTSQFSEWNINQAIVMFRPNEDIISKYISFYMQSSKTINWLENTSKATAGQWNVKVSTCREIPIPICSVEEQKQIVDAIESRLSMADQLEESILQSLDKAEALRQSILKQAFEGKLNFQK